MDERRDILNVSVVYLISILCSARSQVSGIVGRADILATLFSLLSFISHDRYRSLHTSA